MIEASIGRRPVQQAQASREGGGLSWQLPSPETIAAGAHDAGLRHSIEMTRLTRLQVIEGLQQGDYRTCQSYRYALAKEVAEALGALDEAVGAVYVMEYDATPEDVCFCTTGADPRIHLIVRAQRKTHALSALAAALDRALVAVYRDAVCMPDLRSLLDVQVVDEDDVAQRSGYGAMLSSIHHPPLRLWERE
jgi:hypothetical protein